MFVPCYFFLASLIRTGKARSIPTGAKTLLSIMTLSIMTLSIMTLSIMTISITAFSTIINKTRDSA